MNNVALVITFAVVIVILTACGGDKENEQPVQVSIEPSPIVSQPLPNTPIKSTPAVSQITATFSNSTINAVQASSVVNSSGSFAHPFDGETFTGNILVTVNAQDPDGLTSVALSFNNSSQLKYLCEPGDDCPTGVFNKTESNINPADYGVYIGPLTIGLWTLDSLGNQMLVDSLSLDWQLRRIQGANVTRSTDGTQIDVSWQNNQDLLRYNIILAAESGATVSNFTSMNEGQALLSVKNNPQSIAGLSNNQEYYVMISGVDGSGESAFSSEYRMMPPSGNINTVPVVTSEVISSNQNQTINGNVLTNDSDSENDQLSISPLPIRFPLNGDVTLTRDGGFSYTPVTNFSGQDSFVYEVQDGQGGITQGTVNINIGGINEPPQAANDAFSTLQNQQLTVASPGLLANDSDADGDEIQVNIIPITSTSNGTLTLLDDGSFTYMPNQGFSGSDFFTYQIMDTSGLTASAQVDIEVGSVNAPPIAVNDNYTIEEDQTLIVNGAAANSLLSNDFDIDNDPLQLETDLISTVNNGVLTIDNLGTFTYLPNANFYGLDSFTYQINDGQNHTAQATVTFTVTPVNDAPIALDDSYSVDQGNTLTVSAPGLLINDSDLDQDSLSINITPVNSPASGQLNLANDGSFEYTPESGFSGNDSFSYQLTDGNGGVSTAQVSISVLIPTVVLRGTSLTLTGNLTLVGIGETTPGSGIGQVRYTLGDCIQSTNTQCTISGTYQENTNSDHTPGANGSFNMVFSYDGTGPSPVIAASTVPGGNTIAFTELGQSLFTLTLQPSTGGEIIAVFPPSVVDTGLKSFSAFYGANVTCSGLLVGQSCSVGQTGLTAGAMMSGDTSTFNFNIDNPILNNISINTPPVANPDISTVAEDTTVVIDVLSNDTDTDGDSLQVVSASANSGSVVIESNYQLTYTPNSNFNGNDQLTYTIDDGQGATAVGLVDIVVNPVNDLPVVIDESGLITNSVQSMYISVLDNDSDPDQDSLTISDAVTSFGTVSIINNQLYFSPSGLAENTLVLINYSVSDGNGGISNGQVTLAIGNTWPTVVPDKYKLIPETSIEVDGSLHVLPLANDSDVNISDTLTYTQQVFSVQQGVFTENANLASGFTYQANTGFTGVDGGFYEINDSSGNHGEGLFTLQVSDIDWNNQISSPDIPLLDFLDLSFDGVDYALLNNDSVVKAPVVSSGRYYAISGRMVVSSSDKQKWQVEYATNAGNLLAIASGYTIKNPSVNTHIVVGNTGVILINQSNSSDQSDWLEVPTGLNLPFNNIHFDGKQFIAVGLQTVAFTDNGYTWTALPTTNSVEYRDVLSTAGFYLIAGDAGSIESSTNGISWQQQISGTSERLNAIATNDNTYVVVGEGGVIITSNDASSWTVSTSGTTVNLNQVVWNGTLFVAVGDNSTVLTSSDGINWQLQGGIDTGNIRSVLWDGISLLFGSNNGELFNSSDAITYTPLQVPTDNMQAIAFDDNNTLVMAGNPSYLQLSTDKGQNWTQLTALGVMNINAINYYNGQFCAVGANGLILFSRDGSNWNRETTSSTANLNDIYWYSGIDIRGNQFSLYVIVGDNGTILTSQTGVIWTQEQASPAVNDNLYAIDHDATYFTIVGQNGRILVRDNFSTPGSTTWMDFFSNSNWGNLTDVFFNGTNSIIVGSAGRVVTGTAENGFSSRGAITSLDLFSVSGSGNSLIAVGQDGIIYHSSNGGTSWRAGIQSTEFTLMDIHYDLELNEIFTVGDRGTMQFGTDKIN